MGTATEKLWHGRDGSSSLLSTRQLAALGVVMCLPIPTLAVSGLRLPIPESAYTFAANIVAETSGLVAHVDGARANVTPVKTRGTIILSAREQHAAASSAATQ